MASLSHLAMLAARAGDLATARTLLGDALAVAAASRDRPAVVQIETHLANIAQADPAAIPEARRHGEHALALARELGQPYLIASSLHALIHVAAASSDWQRAAELAEEASALCAMLDTQPPPEHLGAPRMKTGTPPSSRLHYGAMQADSLQMLCVARTMLGEPQEALEAERAALAIRQAQNDAVEYAVAVAFGFNEGQYSSGLIRALVELGAYAEALRVSEQRVARMRILDVPYRLC